MPTVRELIEKAEAPEKTPFDYIVVGSGAGGGPLAARLALEGLRVLVIESGLDPGLPHAETGGAFDPPRDSAPNDREEREVYRVPGYHPAAAEDEVLNWDYSVRHYASDALQEEDDKYDPSTDPSKGGAGQPKGGVHYPRCSALGGCTAHHAMIVVKPPAGDWDRIAALTGNDSWRAAHMNSYFTRIENCLYYTQYHSFFRRFLGFVYSGWRRFLAFLNPRLTLDGGGHGFAGWQKTSFIDPVLVFGTALLDSTFRSILLRIFWHLLRAGGLVKLLQRVFVTQWVKFFDPNLDTPRATKNPTLSFIPIGTDGSRRVGVREHLRATATRYPDRLVILTGTHATRVIFADRAEGETPLAIGVEVRYGAHLYDASPRYDAEEAENAPLRRFYASREIVLAAGTFNTPQLLMLSGIGDKQQLRDHRIDGLRGRTGAKVGEIVDLPAVGRNLQDRNEISIISETKKDFRTLRNVSFQPGLDGDRARDEWLRTGRGLYATNGGALAIFMTTNEPRYRDEPDLLIAGFPVAFRGYYRGWSRQLLSTDLRVGDMAWPPEAALTRRLWTWVLLQGHTRNTSGTVELRSDSPFHQPAINFHYFDESSEEKGEDLAALLKGIKWVRKLNEKIKPFKSELQPGIEKNGDYSRELEDWVKYQAWGHHACGTCRMGSDPWRPDTAECDAVVSSDFRVYGVEGLRVVDASVFREIPGYFIAASVFMIGEKAADVLLADKREYPRALHTAEARAVHRRRELALDPPLPPPPANPADAELPADAVGLALSGGGIRSATFALGVVQTLARCDRFRRIDFLSTVSGGGYVGAFLGRLFMRGEQVHDMPRRVQAALANTGSPEMWWLRAHANYISGEGRSDFTSNVATIWRNLVAVHVCIGAFFVAVLASLRLAADAVFAQSDAVTLLGIPLSPWWWLPVVVAAIALVPAALAYWLAPPRASTLEHPRASIPVWLFGLATATSALGVPQLRPYAPVALLLLLLAWGAQEAVRWRATAPLELRGDIARNRLTRAVGESLRLVALCAGWVVLDTLARGAAVTGMLPMAMAGMGGIAATLPVLRAFAANLVRDEEKKLSVVSRWLRRLVRTVLVFVLLGFLLFALDLLVHSAFESGRTLGIWILLAAFGLSLAIGQSSDFPNTLSLQSLYAARLTRTFLGAANPRRVHARPADANSEVQAADPGDDLPFDRYDPQLHGGPLHLINACVNETVDAASARPLRLDKGLQMCIGPNGVSVGRRYHALWEPDANDPHAPRRARVAAVTSGTDPGSFHVLAQRSGEAARVEPLMLSQWISTSGAALGTGLGRHTSLPTSLLLGLFNIRLGYWWDSGIDGGARPGRYPPALLRRLKSSVARIFPAQAAILNEWRGYFTGPSQRLWYLSDGGHFEETGVYELLRRRLPLMICANATEDPAYQLDTIALLMRRARLDFGAEITWLEPKSAPPGGGRWAALDPNGHVPNWVREWIDPAGVGSLWEIGRSGAHSSALARVDYGRSGTTCWLLMINASRRSDLPLDLRSYAARNVQFPHDPTFDQFFTDEQWECYRRLGECTAAAAIRAPDPGSEIPG
jgi:choline dehydrogenase-like flavoprotein